MKTLRTLPRTLSILILFAITLWLIGRSSIPKERTTDIVYAVCTLLMQVLIWRSLHVSRQRIVEALKKEGIENADDTGFRNDRDDRAAIRKAAHICWDAAEGNDARQPERRVDL